MDPYLQFGSQVNLKYFTYTSEANFIGQLLETVELPGVLRNVTRMS